MAHPVTSAVLGAVGILVVIAFGLAVARSAGWTATELPLLQVVNDLHNPALSAVALVINTLFSPPVAMVISVLGAAVTFIGTASLVRAGVFLFVIAGAWGCSEVVKYIVQRPRASASVLAHPMLVETSFSYPSGHTCFVTALTLAIVITCRNNRWRTLVIIVGPVAVVVVALSRMYLGVHYPTDVTAAAVYSASAACIVAPITFNVVVPWLRRRLPSTGGRISLLWGTGYSVLSTGDERGGRAGGDEAALAADRGRP
jgi:Membrane-associated phospholipid phosphatase